MVPKGRPALKEGSRLLSPLNQSAPRVGWDGTGHLWEGSSWRLRIPWKGEQWGAAISQLTIAGSTSWQRELGVGHVRAPPTSLTDPWPSCF